MIDLRNEIYLVLDIKNCRRLPLAGLWIKQRPHIFPQPVKGFDREQQQQPRHHPQPPVAGGEVAHRLSQNNTDRRQVG